MNFPSSEIVKNLKKEFPPGTKVNLVRLNDKYRSIPTGTQGTVVGVDDTGTIHCYWMGYGRLGLAYGEDECKKTKEACV